METLNIKFLKKLEFTSMQYVRDFITTIDWDNRLIGIKGARGAGKTTLLLQQIKTRHNDFSKVLYVSLDDLFFHKKTLYDLASEFEKNGGKFLYLDEVHRYKNWSGELKNIYDDFPEIQLVFTGSSILHLSQFKADLSRRAVMYELRGLSFREYLGLTQNLIFETLTLNEILLDHEKIALKILSKIKPIGPFKSYLKSGYYPYFLENENFYSQKLSETINLAMETDLPAVFEISYPSIDKLKTLLVVLAESVPFKPNISKLSGQVGVTRNSIVEFLHYLEDLRIISMLHRKTKGITRMQKPDKIYLYHPNLYYSLTPETANTGSVRESFFINQVSESHKVNYSDIGDFVVEGKYLFETGGANKKNHQITGIKDSFVVADNIEIGYKNKIPLWLFGFLY